MRLLVFGNSGSGKSTLARRTGLPHLDLDTLAWEPRTPPARRPLVASAREINAFVRANETWVIEGCYADLLALAAPRCTRMIFLNPGVEACVAQAKARPWEPHKYASKDAQDANLAMLIDWIRAYPRRIDEFSLAAHRALFDGFPGDKSELASADAIAAWRPIPHLPDDM